MLDAAADLLEAVGVDWQKDDSLHTWDNGLTSTCLYNGPALGTPELDAILLVAGQRWLRENVNKSLWHVIDALPDNKFHNPALTLLLNELPGHALARAIRDVGKA